MMKKTKFLIVLASTSAMTLLISNLAATKLWLLPGINIAVDGGLLIFPLSYVIGDLIVEFYGERIANEVVWLSMVLNLIAMLTFVVVKFLPPFPGWEGQEAYETILGFAPRIMLGSLAAYVASGLTNNYAFAKIKRRQFDAYDKNKRKQKNDREFWALIEEYDGRVPFFEKNPADGYGLRAIGSSIFGRLIDNLIFETVAFLGVLPLKDFIPQMTGAFVEGLLVEAVLTFTVSRALVRIVNRYIACGRL